MFDLAEGKGCCGPDSIYISDFQFAFFPAASCQKGEQTSPARFFLVAAEGFLEVEEVH